MHGHMNIKGVCDIFRYKCTIFREHNKAGSKPTDSYMLLFRGLHSLKQDPLSTSIVYRR